MAPCIPDGFHSVSFIVTQEVWEQRPATAFIPRASSLSAEEEEQQRRAISATSTPACCSPSILTWTATWLLMEAG